MSNQSTHHDQSLPNSIPQTHHNQPIAPIKPENDSTDDDVVFVESVRKVHNTLDDYDPECQCRMCQLVKKFYAEHTHACNCPCEQCRERQTNQVNQEQVVESSENVPIANAASPTNGQPSSSSINQNNDAATSEHANANDLVDDDRESRSSTPDYMPRFFDDENGDSDSDSENFVDSGVDQDDMELDQESDNDDNDDDGNKNDPEYANAVSPTNGQPSSSSIIQNNDASTSEHTNANDERETTSQCSRCRRKVQFLMAHLRHHKYSGFRCTWPNCGFFYTKLSKAKKHICVDHLQVNASTNSPQVRHYLIRVGPKLDKNPRRRSPNLTSSTSENDLLSSDMKEQATDNDESLKSNTEQTSFGCPKSEASFGETSRLVRNHRSLYQEWKPFYCKWPKCDFVSDTRDTVADHANSKHFKLLNKTRARKYVGMHN